MNTIIRTFSSFPITKKSPLKFNIHLCGIRTNDNYKIDIISKVSLTLIDNINENRTKIKENQQVKNVIENNITFKDFRNLLFHDDKTEKNIKNSISDIYKNCGYNLEYFKMDVKVIEKGKNMISGGSRGGKIISVK